MKEAPEFLDGAQVIYWAWSDPPFFVMPSADGMTGVAINGLAICRYDKGPIYRFSCNAEWNVENDLDFDTAEAAMSGLSGQYDVHKVKWQKR